MNMKVSRTGPASPADRSRKSGAPKPAGSSAFSDHLAGVDGSGPGPSTVSEGAQITGVGAILAAQEVPGSDDQRTRRAVRQYGDDILDRLDEIRHQILFGGISRQKLENLAKMLRTRRETVNDPQLIEIMQEIEIRAEVEIAKYTRGR